MKLVGSNLKKLKNINVELVKGTLIRLGSCTKLTVSKETGLSIATCGNILNELLETGEVLEGGASDSNGGRPATLFQYNANCRHIACLYLVYEHGVCEILYTVLNMLGEELTRERLQQSQLEYPCVQKLVADLTAGDNLIQAVGIGVPGVVGKNDEIFESDVDTLVDLPLGDLLKKDFPDIKFAVENDMNLMALGFYQKQAYQEDKTVAVIDFPWEFCVGSGIIVDGHIMKGNTNFASEISYLPFLPQGGSRRLCDLPDDAIIGYAVQTLVSMVAIINPDTIVLIDKLIRPDMLEAIRQGCQHIIPRRHMPRILISGEHHNFGLAGLAHATMECLDYNLMLVEKRL